MIYRPPKGKFKDNCILWHRGEFFLYSMYSKVDAKNVVAEHDHYRNIWMARSKDGVHWSDCGMVLEDSEMQVWAMKVHKVDDMFVMNHGSFDEHGNQNTLRMLYSYDLCNWKYFGEDMKIVSPLNPDGTVARLDVMNVLKYGDRYYGYATGRYGFLESKDGLKWEFEDSTDVKVEFDDIMPPARSIDDMPIEVGDCAMVEGKCYLLAGWFGCFGTNGYGMYTLVADSPEGVFHPDQAAFRISGNSTRWVMLWARFCQTDKDLLVHGYMYDGHSYEIGNTWLPPMKKAIVDKFGHLRLAYWHGNDVMRGERIHMRQFEWEVFSCTKSAVTRTGEKLKKWNGNSILLSSDECRVASGPAFECSVAILDVDVDMDPGVTVQGRIRLECDNRRQSIPVGGIVLEETENTGTAILLECCGITRIGLLEWRNQAKFFSDDEISGKDARPMGITPFEDHPFRLLLRGGMFELYIDDMYVETFNTARDDSPGLPIKRIGFLCSRGRCFVEDIEINRATLS